MTKPKRKSKNDLVEILIVEDSPTQAAKLEHILQQADYQVAVVPNGKEALACIGRRKPTLVISDIIMPEMDGYELCKRLKSDINLSDIPIILLTTLSDPQDVVRGLECGADHFIAKPYDAKTLISRLNSVLSNLERRKTQNMGIGVEILIAGEKYFITADRMQILDFLISTYETAVQQNRELTETRDALSSLNETLEEKVKERTAELTAEVTQRKAAEETLRLSKERLIEAQRIGKIGNWEWNPAEDKVIWSAEMYDIFGIAPETVLTTEMSMQAFHPEDRAMVAEATRKTVAELKPQLIECRILKPDGTIGYVLGRGETVLDANGKLVKMIGIYQDITERKQLEKAQQESKELAVIKQAADESSEYAESVINTVREPLISLDQDLRVVSVSRSFYDFFQVKPEETMGQLIYDLGNKQWDIPKLRELLEKILPQQTTFDNYEVEHDFTTIGRRIMLLNARQIQRASGKERIILLAIEDITERKQIEAGLETAHEELKELATELERAARVKSEFLANMSHELRTPLNSINGFSEVLFDETFGPLNEKQKKYVNNVLASGKHLLLLINQILDTAKVEAGKMKLTLSSLPMKSLLSEIALLVADMISQKKIEMSLEIAEDLPDIEADELKIKEIIYNLLSNAVKFTPEGGQIGMRAKKADSEIEIVVWDTGVGIAPENIGKIFEGFFRVDTPYSRVTEGTGLGLPLSRKLVELHGGTLSVESGGLNKGTFVRFTLPILSRIVA